MKPLKKKLISSMIFAVFSILFILLIVLAFATNHSIAIEHQGEPFPINYQPSSDGIDCLKIDVSGPISRRLGDVIIYTVDIANFCNKSIYLDPANYDFLVINPDKTTRWQRWASVPVIGEQFAVVMPNESIVLETHWNGRDWQGNRLPRDIYTIVAILKINDEFIKSTGSFDTRSWWLTPYIF